MPLKLNDILYIYLFQNMYGSRVKHFTRFYTFSLYGDISLVLGPEPLIQGPYISQFTKMMDIVNMHLGFFSSIIFL